MKMERLRLPDPDCGSICSNALTDRCVEDCSLEGECRLLELKKNLKLADMPKYPKMENKTWQARARLRDAYMEKIVSHLQGESNESNHPPYYRGTDFNAETSLPVSSALKIQNVLPSVARQVTVFENRKVRKSKDVRSSAVDQSAD
jgi:hypothetical protein